MAPIQREHRWISALRATVMAMRWCSEESRSDTVISESLLHQHSTALCPALRAAKAQKNYLEKTQSPSETRTSQHQY